MTAKATRIILNLLLSPGLAVLLLVIPVSVYARQSPGLQIVTTMLLYGYAFATIPSVVHVFIMEYFYRRGLDPAGKKAIGMSAASGLFAGLLVLLIIVAVFRESDWKILWLSYPLWGAATGAVTAVVISLFSRAKNKPNQ
jgi:cation transporter-like permease